MKPGQSASTAAGMPCYQQHAIVQQQLQFRQERLAQLQASLAREQRTCGELSGKTVRLTRELCASLRNNTWEKNHRRRLEHRLIRSRDRLRASLPSRYQRVINHHKEIRQLVETHRREILACQARIEELQLIKARLSESVCDESGSGPCSPLAAFPLLSPQSRSTEARGEEKLCCNESGRPAEVFDELAGQDGSGRQLWDIQAKGIEQLQDYIDNCKKRQSALNREMQRLHRQLHFARQRSLREKSRWLNLKRQQIWLTKARMHMLRTEQDLAKLHLQETVQLTARHIWESSLYEHRISQLHEPTVVQDDYDRLVSPPGLDVLDDSVTDLAGTDEAGSELSPVSPPVEVNISIHRSGESAVDQSDVDAGAGLSLNPDLSTTLALFIGTLAPEQMKSIFADYQDFSQEESLFIQISESLNSLSVSLPAFDELAPDKSSWDSTLVKYVLYKANPGFVINFNIRELNFLSPYSEEHMMLVYNYLNQRDTKSSGEYQELLTELKACVPLPESSPVSYYAAGFRREWTWKHLVFLRCLAVPSARRHIQAEVFRIVNQEHPVYREMNRQTTDLTVEHDSWCVDATALCRQYLSKIKEKNLWTSAVYVLMNRDSIPIPDWEELKPDSRRSGEWTIELVKYALYRFELAGAKTLNLKCLQVIDPESKGYLQVLSDIYKEKKTGFLQSLNRNIARGECEYNVPFPYCSKSKMEYFSGKGRQGWTRWHFLLIQWINKPDDIILTEKCCYQVLPLINIEHPLAIELLGLYLEQKLGNLPVRQMISSLEFISGRCESIALELNWLLPSVTANKPTGMQLPVGPWSAQDVITFIRNWYTCCHEHAETPGRDYPVSSSEAAGPEEVICTGESDPPGKTSPISRSVMEEPACVMDTGVGVQQQVDSETVSLLASNNPLMLATCIGFSSSEEVKAIFADYQECHQEESLFIQVSEYLNSMALSPPVLDELPAGKSHWDSTLVKYVLYKANPGFIVNFNIKELNFLNPVSTEHMQLVHDCLKQKKTRSPCEYQELLTELEAHVPLPESSPVSYYAAEFRKQWSLKHLAFLHWLATPSASRNIQAEILQIVNQDHPIYQDIKQQVCHFDETAQEDLQGAQADPEQMALQMADKAGTSAMDYRCYLSEKLTRHKFPYGVKTALNMDSIPTPGWTELKPDCRDSQEWTMHLVKYALYKFKLIKAISLNWKDLQVIDHKSGEYLQLLLDVYRVRNRFHKKTIRSPSALDESGVAVSFPYCSRNQKEYFSDKGRQEWTNQHFTLLQWLNQPETFTQNENFYRQVLPLINIEHPKAVELLGGFMVKGLGTLPSVRELRSADQRLSTRCERIAKGMNWLLPVSANKPSTMGLAEGRWTAQDVVSFLCAWQIDSDRGEDSQLQGRDHSQPSVELNCDEEADFSEEAPGFEDLTGPQRAEREQRKRVVRRCKFRTRSETVDSLIALRKAFAGCELRKWAGMLNRYNIPTPEWDELVSGVREQQQWSTGLLKYALYKHGLSNDNFLRINDLKILDPKSMVYLQILSENFESRALCGRLTPNNSNLTLQTINRNNLEFPFDAEENMSYFSGTSMGEWTKWHCDLVFWLCQRSAFQIIDSFYPNAIPLINMKHSAAIELLSDYCHWFLGMPPPRNLLKCPTEGFKRRCMEFAGTLNQLLPGGSSKPAVPGLKEGLWDLQDVLTLLCHRRDDAGSDNGSDSFGAG